MKQAREWKEVISIVGHDINPEGERSQFKESVDPVDLIEKTPLIAAAQDLYRDLEIAIKAVDLMCLLIAHEDSKRKARMLVTTLNATLRKARGES